MITHSGAKVMEWGYIYFFILLLATSGQSYLEAKWRTVKSLKTKFYISRWKGTLKYVTSATVKWIKLKKFMC